MVTPLIKPVELTLLSTYLHDLQAYVAGGENDRNFYKRWADQIDLINEIISRLDTYLAAKDSDTAYQVERSKRLDSHSNEFTACRKQVPYYLAGIKAYQQEVENDLIQSGLLHKPIQEMTGFEFKTLLLATLKEHQDRKGN